jgi:hypothetical protein
MEMKEGSIPRAAAMIRARASAPLGQWRLGQKLSSGLTTCCTNARTVACLLATTMRR